MFTSPLNRLRQSTWLAAIPDTLTVPEIGGRPGRSLSIERATVDDVALALSPWASSTRRSAASAPR